MCVICDYSNNHDNAVSSYLSCHVEVYGQSTLLKQNNARQEIRVKPGIFDRVSASVRRKAENCVEMRGNHRDHLM
jgi:hypothetical protein